MQRLCWIILDRLQDYADVSTLSSVLFAHHHLHHRSSHSR